MRLGQDESHQQADVTATATTKTVLGTVAATVIVMTGETGTTSRVVTGMIMTETGSVMTIIPGMPVIATNTDVVQGTAMPIGMLTTIPGGGGTMVGEMSVWLLGGNERHVSEIGIASRLATGSDRPPVTIVTGVIAEV